MNITIETLWKQGKNKSEIERITGHSWKTVSKRVEHLKQGKKVEKQPHPKLLDVYKEDVIKLMEENLTRLRIFEKLQKLGSKACYSTVNNYISHLKKNENITIRFHTAPGEEAQVDFGYAGYTKDTSGKKRKTWVFDMVLSYSRQSYYEKVYDQKVETFIQCHINAFNYFNGVPKYVKIDNLKSAILNASFYEVVYQNLYKSFADYYHFSPLPCRVRQPQEKGKVESGIKYVKRNFFSGRDFKDSDDLDYRLKRWLDNTCNKRIHGTTKRVPYELFDEEEKKKLLPVPTNDFLMPEVSMRKVQNDCHVYFGHNYYSVPYKHVGENVEVKATAKIVKFYFNDSLLAAHPRSFSKGQFMTSKAHYPSYKNHLSTEYRESYYTKMKELGEYAGEYFLFLVEIHPTDWNRTVRGVLSLKKQYPNELLDLACKRALAYQSDKYSMFKSICKKGTYKLAEDNSYGGFYELH